MKTTIKFFATFLTFIFLTSIIQAQTPRDGTGGKRTSARIPGMQKETAQDVLDRNEEIKKQNAELFARRAEMQKQAARQKAIKEGIKFEANRRNAALQNHAAKQRATKEGRKPEVNKPVPATQERGKIINECGEGDYIWEQ